MAAAGANLLAGEDYGGWVFVGAVPVFLGAQVAGQGGTGFDDDGADAGAVEGGLRVFVYLIKLDKIVEELIAVEVCAAVDVDVVAGIEFSDQVAAKIVGVEDWRGQILLIEKGGSARGEARSFHLLGLRETAADEFGGERCGQNDGG